ncbi:hypothetical protein [Sphingomonas sp. 28-62-20]|uniref:hypothetical protein n=1 Tax=Sphingomonas sp. 28-62-20 TaxID=1970433 RepID=UPI0035A895D1
MMAMLCGRTLAAGAIMLLCIGIASAALFLLGFLQYLARDGTKLIRAAHQFFDTPIQKCLFGMISMDEHRIALLVHRFAQHGIGNRLVQIIELLRHRRNLRAPVRIRLENIAAVPVIGRLVAHLFDKIHRNAQVFAQHTYQYAQPDNIARRRAQPLGENGGNAIGTPPHLITQHLDEFSGTILIGFRKPIPNSHDANHDARAESQTDRREEQLEPIRNISPTERRHNRNAVARRRSCGICCHEADRPAKTGCPHHHPCSNRESIGKR